MDIATSLIDSTKPKRKRRTREEMELAKAEILNIETTKEVIEGNYFTFIGNGKDDPKRLSLYGYEFKLNGAPVLVTEEFAIYKLTLMSGERGHFKHDKK